MFHLNCTPLGKVFLARLINFEGFLNMLYASCTWIDFVFELSYAVLEVFLLLLHLVLLTVCMRHRAPVVVKRMKKSISRVPPIV